MRRIRPVIYVIIAMGAISALPTASSQASKFPCIIPPLQTCVRLTGTGGGPGTYPAFNATYSSGVKLAITDTYNQRQMTCNYARFYGNVKGDDYYDLATSIGATSGTDIRNCSGLGYSGEGLTFTAPYIYAKSNPTGTTVDLSLPNLYGELEFVNGFTCRVEFKGEETAEYNSTTHLFSFTGLGFVRVSNIVNAPYCAGAYAINDLLQLKGQFQWSPSTFKMEVH